MAMKSSKPPACDENGIFHIHCLACGHPMDVWPDYAHDCEEFSIYCLKCGAEHEFSETLVISSFPRRPEKPAGLCLECQYEAPSAERPSSPDEAA
jgi:hypothetical protein